MAERKLLLIGATGVFGARLARQLALCDGIALSVASRDASRAAGLAAAIGHGATAGVTGVAFDNRRDLQQLATMRPWLVIDASGPFQGCDYALAEASLKSGAHFIDLADARDYVLGFAAALDPLARDRNLVALTGASSTPALSSAAVAALTEGWRQIDSVDCAIAPGGASDVGLSVTAAILSYAGRPVAVFRDGQPQHTVGWGSVERRDFPGLGRRFVSPVETPDSELLPKFFGVREQVRFFAGLESPLEHFGLLALARSDRDAPPRYWRRPSMARGASRGPFAGIAAACSSASWASTRGAPRQNRNGA